MEKNSDRATLLHPEPLGDGPGRSGGVRRKQERQRVQSGVVNTWMVLVLGWLLPRVSEKFTHRPKGQGPPARGTLLVVLISWIPGFRDAVALEGAVMAGIRLVPPALSWSSSTRPFDKFHAPHSQKRPPANSAFGEDSG